MVHVPSFAHIGQTVFKEARQFPSQTVDGQTVKENLHDHKVIELVRQTRRLQNYIGMLRKDILRSTPLHQQALNRTSSALVELQLQHGPQLDLLLISSFFFRNRMQTLTDRSRHAARFFWHTRQLIRRWRT